jgi:hypothetical protein
MFGFARFVAKAFIRSSETRPPKGAGTPSSVAAIREADSWDSGLPTLIQRWWWSSRLLATPISGPIAQNEGARSYCLRRALHIPPCIQRRRPAPLIFGVRVWAASTTNVRVSRSIGQGIQPFQLMVNAKGLGEAEGREGRLYTRSGITQQFEILHRAGRVADFQIDAMPRNYPSVLLREIFVADPAIPAAMTNRRGGSGSTSQ